MCNEKLCFFLTNQDIKSGCSSVTYLKEGFNPYCCPSALAASQKVLPLGSLHWFAVPPCHPAFLLLLAVCTPAGLLSCDMCWWLSQWMRLETWGVWLLLLASQFFQLYILQAWHLPALLHVVGCSVMLCFLFLKMLFCCCGSTTVSAKQVK